MSSTLIFWPMIILAIATMLIYVAMSRARVKTVKDGTVSASVYRHNVGEPEESLRFNKAIENQFESPVLFYTVCLAAYASGNASAAMITLAWLYALVKVAHMYIHTTSNKLGHRRPIFMVSMLLLVLMWMLFGFQLLGML